MASPQWLATVHPVEQWSGGAVARGTVECGALSVNMRIRKSKTSVLENGLTF